MNLTKADMLDFLGLDYDPFAKPQRAEDLFPSLALRSCRNLVRYAVQQREIVAIVGEYGAGKTTAWHQAVDAVREDCATVTVDAAKATLTIGQVIEAMLLGLGHDRLPQSQTARRRLLRRAWIEAHESGKPVLLVIDEAHLVPGTTAKALKELHEQSRHGPRESLFACLLTGHRQLSAVYADQARDLYARLEAHNILYLAPFDRDEGADYLKHRLAAANGLHLLPPPELLRRLARRETALGLGRTMWRLFEAATRLGVREINDAVAREAFPERMAPGTPVAADAATLDRILRGGTDATQSKERAPGAAKGGPRAG